MSDNINVKNRVLWITQTAMLLAVAVLSQTYLMPILGGPGNPVSQLAVGSIVNFCLVLAALTSGFLSGAAIAVCTPFIAFLMGITVYPQQIIIVALGNTAIVFIFWVICRKKILGKHDTFNWGAAAIIGSVSKFIVLWFGMTKIFIELVLKNDAALNEVQLARMTAMITLTFTWNQLATALTGSILAFMIFRALKPVFSDKKIKTSKKPG